MFFYYSYVKLLQFDLTDCFAVRDDAEQIWVLIPNFVIFKARNFNLNTLFCIYRQVNASRVFADFKAILLLYLDFVNLNK